MPGEPPTSPGGLTPQRRAQLRAEREARHAARDAQRRRRGRERRRVRLRRTLRVAGPVALLVVMAGAGLGFVAGQGRTSAARSAGPTLERTPSPAPAPRPGEGVRPNDPDDPEAGGGPAASQTLANGPVPRPPSSDLLDLKLASTTDAFTIAFAKPPRAGLLFDLDTGRVLWRRNPTRVLPIASVTKMMTALVVVTDLEPGSKVRITKAALRATGSAVGVLPLGRSVGLSAMLHGLLLASGNDAAIALAIAASGSQRAFIREMNARARAMGLGCTHYTSPSGIVDEGNHSCAADLAVQAKAVLDDPRLAPIVGRREAALRFPIKGGKLFLTNHNPLLKSRFPGTIGVKTGFTTAAGKTFVAAVKHRGRRYGLVLLHSPDIKTQAEQLFRRAYRADGAR